MLVSENYVDSDIISLTEMSTIQILIECNKTFSLSSHYTCDTASEEFCFCTFPSSNIDSPMMTTVDNIIPSNTCILCFFCLCMIQNLFNLI